MKIVKYFAMMAAMVVALAGCDNGNNGENNNGNDGGLKVTASTSTIYADGKDQVVFSVSLDGEAVDAGEITAYDAVTNNIVPMEGLTFTTTTAGVYEFYFKSGEQKSDNVTITAVDAKLSKLDLSTIEGQEGLSVMATSTVFQRDAEEVYFIVRRDGAVVIDANKIKFWIGDQEITDTDFEMVDYVDANDDLYTLPKYTPTETGVRDIWISYGNTDNHNKPLRITAVDFAIPSRAIDSEPNNTSFAQRIFVNQFTGTGCPNCPYWTAAIKDLKADEQYKDKFVVAAVHNYNNDSQQDGIDKLTIQAPYSSVGNAMGVSSWPTVIFDMRYSHGNGGRTGNRETLQNYINRVQMSACPVGISARSAMEGNTVIVRATVKANKAGEYRVGAWLVEDDLYAPQNNTSQIFDYDFDYHHNVVRIADSQHSGAGQLNYRGYSLGEMSEGQVTDHVFTMEMAEHWRSENCRLVLFVTGGEDNIVLNAIETSSLNHSVSFEYK